MEIWPELYEGNCVWKENKIYYYAYNFNALCSLNLLNGVVEVEADISGEYFDEVFLVSNICAYRNYMVCIPGHAKQIHIIDMSLPNRKGVLIPENEKLPSQSYYNFCVIDKFCFLFPFTADKTLKIDLEEKCIIEELNVKAAYEKVSGSNYCYFSNSGCCVLNNKIFMVLRDSPTIAEYNVDSGQILFYKIHFDSRLNIFVAGCGDYVYILGYEGNVCVWNTVNCEVEKIVCLELCEGEIERFKYSAQWDKYIYLFKGVFSNEFIRIDTEKRLVETRPIRQAFDIEAPEDLLFIFMTMDQGKLYFWTDVHLVYTVDLTSKLTDRIPLVLNETGLKIFIQNHMSELNSEMASYALEGSCVWTLENYIKKCVYSRNTKSEEIKQIGNDIHIAVK